MGWVNFCIEIILIFLINFAVKPYCEFIVPTKKSSSEMKFRLANDIVFKFLIFNLINNH